jgi:hypothetical protein
MLTKQGRMKKLAEVAATTMMRMTTTSLMATTTRVEPSAKHPHQASETGVLCNTAYKFRGRKMGSSHQSRNTNGIGFTS